MGRVGYGAAATTVPPVVGSEMSVMEKALCRDSEGSKMVPLQSREMDAPGCPWGMHWILIMYT